MIDARNVKSRPSRNDPDGLTYYYEGFPNVCATVYPNIVLDVPRWCVEVNTRFDYRYLEHDIAGMLAIVVSHAKVEAKLRNAAEKR